MDLLNTLSRFFRRLAGISTFNPEACIGYVLDKTDLEANRVAAAESLGYGELGSSLSRAVDALYQVACDEGDLYIVREEAAEALASIWERIGVDRARFARLPEDVKLATWGVIPPGSRKGGLE
jgi:hypothetical protein